MTALAFELREKYADFSGGTVSPNGKTFDFGAALQEHNGRIVVDTDVDPALAEALNDVPALKKVGTEEGEEPSVDQLEILKVTELRSLANRRGVTVDGRTKQAYIDAIRAGSGEDQEGS